MKIIMAAIIDKPSRGPVYTICMGKYSSVVQLMGPEPDCLFLSQLVSLMSVTLGKLLKLSVPNCPHL